MTASGMTANAEDIEQRAADWLARRDLPDWNHEREGELDAWLAQSTANRVAFLRLQAAWARAERLRSLRAPNSKAGPNQFDATEDAQCQAPGELPARARAFNWPLKPDWAANYSVYAVAACLVGVVAVALIVGDTWGLRNANSAYNTEIGGREVVPLADGSKVELNTNSRLRASVTAERRAVWLDQGEAYFEVAHDASRPFIVYAGSRRITVVGTKFDVRRDGEDIQVKVTEGIVHVDALEPDPANAPAALPVVVVGGHEAITKAKATLVATRSPDGIERDLSWRQGLLSFDNGTLADAAREFNRYNRKKLIVADGGASNIRLGGSFEASNVEAFARLLEQGYGLHAQISSDQIVISR